MRPHRAICCGRFRFRNDLSTLNTEIRQASRQAPPRQSPVPRAFACRTLQGHRPHAGGQLCTMTATYAASRRLGRVMPPPEVPALLPGAPPPSTKEATEQPESRYYSLEKMWAGTHPAVQGGIILGLTVIFVMLIRAIAPVALPIIRIWRGRPEKEPVDVPALPPPPPPPPPYTPPPEPTEADKRHAELLAATERAAAEARAARQSVHDSHATLTAASAGLEKRLERRMDRLENRLEDCVSQREIDTLLELIKRLSAER